MLGIRESRRQSPKANVPRGIGPTSRAAGVLVGGLAPPPAQAYLKRLQATGKSKREALRVLKRRLVRVIFNLLHADLDQTGLGQSAAPLPAHEPAA